MSLNDTDFTLGGSKGVDQHPGIANPTAHSVHPDPMTVNFVTDPTDESHGAGAGDHFTGDKDAARIFSSTAGVCEGRPGIIESANIDPLNENSNKDDGWANAQAKVPSGDGENRAATGGVAQGAYNTAASMASGAASMASGAAQTAYSYVAGDEKSRKAGKETSA